MPYTTRPLNWLRAQQNPPTMYYDEYDAIEIEYRRRAELQNRRLAEMRHQLQVQGLGAAAQGIFGQGGYGAALGGTQELTPAHLEYARMMLDRMNVPQEYLNIPIDKDIGWVYDANNKCFTLSDKLTVAVLKTLLEVESKHNMELNEDKDMAETIEVALESNVINSICTSLVNFSKGKDDEIGYYETQLKKVTKDKFPDAETRKAYLDIWESRLKNTLETVKLCEKINTKLKATARPVKLQKNERKVLATVLDNLNIDYSLICPFSNISNINHPDRFYGFPSLEKTMKNKIAELTACIKSLTRSDVNVYVK